MLLAQDLANDPNFHGSLFLGFDAQEQSGEFTGIREVLKCAPQADICILGYQGIREISIGARGWLRLKLTVHGRAAHTGSRSRQGVNAIHQMNRAIEKILVLDLNATQPFFEYGSSINVVQISGGIAVNVVPDTCEAIIDIRLVPMQSSEILRGHIEEALISVKRLDSNFHFSLETLQTEQAYLSDPINVLIKKLQKQAELTLGRRVPLTTSGQGSAGNIISRLGIPIINAFGCESGNVHAPNEWINIETISEVYRIYRNFMIESMLAPARARSTPFNFYPPD